MWRTAGLSVAASAAFAVVVFASVAQAATLTVNSSVVPIGGTPSYLGPTLDTSSMFNFGGGMYLVSAVGAGNQSGLAPGDLVTFSNPLFNSDVTSLTKSGADTTAAFTVSFTPITLTWDSPLVAVLFSGSIVPAIVSDSVVLAETTSTVMTPIPATLTLFATGLGLIVGLLAWRRKRRALRSVFLGDEYPA